MISERISGSKNHALVKCKKPIFVLSKITTINELAPLCYYSKPVVNLAFKILGQERPVTASLFWRRDSSEL